MKRIIGVILLLCILFSGCKLQQTEPYQYTDYSLFDTVTTILGYGVSQKAFRTQAESACAQLQVYHRLFDVYNDYEGIHNIKTINDMAGIGPVTVEQPILDLLASCRDYWELTDHKVNAAMGSVLKLWHEKRDLAERDPLRAEVPTGEMLQNALEHMDFSLVELDFENRTVFIKDPEIRLDVGAVAKGFAAQQVSRILPPGMLLSIGGNVCVTGPKKDGSPWIVGIQNPRGEGYLRTVNLEKGSAVTSGDYQRYYEVEGKRYHHIIDPKTGFPGTYWSSVTVLCEDSGLADALSTALFLLPREDGQQLLNQLGAEAMWVDLNGEYCVSSGFPE